jgi:RimJ/RimL family protein N-acetyltransferase
LEYGFKELDQSIMYAMTHKENAASNKVLHKIGFKKTDTFTHNNDPCFFHECVRN